MNHEPRSRVHVRHIPLSETIEAWIFIVGIVVAFWFVQSGAVVHFISAFGEYRGLAALTTGMFYTSILTTTPAIVAFAELSAFVPAWKIAVLGSIGAVGAEMLMLRFIRSPFMEHLMRAAFHPRARTFGRKVTSGMLWWLAPLCGAFVLRSPPPS